VLVSKLYNCADACALVQGYKSFGINRADGVTTYREWAPAAQAAWLIGDFNEWQGTALEKNEFGVWSASLPDGAPAIPHGSRVKVRLQHWDSWTMDRVPAWTRYAVMEQRQGATFDGVHWDPPASEQHQWCAAACARRHDGACVGATPHVSVCVSPDIRCGTCSCCRWLRSSTLRTCGSAADRCRTSRNSSRSQSERPALPPPCRQHDKPPWPEALRIYEAHVGMSSEEPVVATYTHFREHVLPRIAAQHFNCIQLMAVQEHPYYASFGCACASRAKAM
jgi:1,4-alpha-glucan branching enzyme